MVKNLPSNARDIRETSSIPGSGRSLGVGNGNPGFLPGKSRELRRLVGYSPWDRKESDTTEQARMHTQEGTCPVKTEAKREKRAEWL